MNLNVWGGRYKIFTYGWPWEFGYRKPHGGLAQIIDWHFSLGPISIWRWRKPFKG